VTAWEYQVLVGSLVHYRALFEKGSHTSTSKLSYLTYLNPENAISIYLQNNGNSTYIHIA
jgi:hypothetical protein